MNNCITCKKNNKGDNWRNCRLKCHYRYEQQKKDEIYKLQEENARLKKTIEKIKALNLFSLNNSREKIAEINAIINDQKESEER